MRGCDASLMGVSKDHSKYLYSPRRAAPVSWCSPPAKGFLCERGQAWGCRCPRGLQSLSVLGELVLMSYGGPFWKQRDPPVSRIETRISFVALVPALSRRWEVRLIFRKSTPQGRCTCSRSINSSEQVELCRGCPHSNSARALLERGFVGGNMRTPVAIILRERWCDCTVAMLNRSRSDKASACGDIPGSWVLGLHRTDRVRCTMSVRVIDVRVMSCKTSQCRFRDDGNARRRNCRVSLH